MPEYDYKCPKCGARQTRHKPMEERYDVKCAECGERCTIVLSAVPRMWRCDTGGQPCDRS